MNVLAKFLTTTVLALGLAGGAQAETAIDYFFPVPVDGPLAKEMNRLVGEFNKSHPDIKVTPVYTGSYDETSIKARSAAKAGKPPAVVLMSANFVVEYKVNGEIEALDDFAKSSAKSADAFMNQFWEPLHANARFDGRIWGVPFHNSTPLVYYNVEHFKEAGLDPNNFPKTWAEFADAAKKLTKRDGDSIKRYGFMMPQGYDYLGWLVSALDMSNGGQYFNAEYPGIVYYNTPTMLGTVTFINDLIRKHKVMPDSVQDAKAVSTSFFAGETSMIMYSTGSLSAIRAGAKFPYKVAFVPANVRNAVPIGGASLIMMKGLSTEQKNAAWELMTWLTSPEISGGWSRFTGYFAPNKAAYDLPEMKQFLAEHEDAKVALEQLQYAKPWFATIPTVPVRKAIEDEVQAVINGKKTPKDAIADAQKKADELMAPYVAKTALQLP
jgi:sn-glycerol 3-phosphate transport system substrate-binding protein